MPFSPSDAKKHKKDVPKGLEEKWSAVANSVLRQTDDEGKAIRIANAAVGKSEKRRR